ncbi:MAG TPA: hypothetical protein VEH04_05150 [Verrucomicrobiae bacterium]|nr:hypothetical protein [Verrucomicrobiae bacterium]
MDSELTNYKSGIDVTWGGEKGVDYYEEYYFHDKLLDDHKVVYIRDTTKIAFSHNARNVAYYHSTEGGRQKIGANGKDGIANSGDEGIIRYKIDRDRQYKYKWAMNSAGTDANFVLPAAGTGFTLKEIQFEPGVPVVGSVGPSSDVTKSKGGTYFRGLLDSFGDEWHTLAYADDDRAFLWARYVATSNFVDQAWYASDGKTVQLVVNPKTPCLTMRATGTGQFYTTPPKAYWTPKLVPQITYLSAGTDGAVSIELRDIYGNEVFYRINGGEFQGAKGNSVVISHTEFSRGTNTLDYYYAGKQAFTKTRIVVKDPEFPSRHEPHGTYLWVDSAGYSTVRNRLHRPPYAATYLAYKSRSEVTGQESWDKGHRRGDRVGGAYALENAFVAKVEGFDFARSGASRSHGVYAKEMLLEQTRNTDPLGFELQHSSDSIPTRELHYRGYYDSLPILKGIFAYDIMVANFRSDQVDGGITAVEDYFIRDKFAGFVYEAMQWSADMTALGAPGMWGGARMMCAQSIAMILREYSTPYYGTSGFGTNQTTYPLCPYDEDRYTWKEALFDATGTRRGFPNLQWFTGLSENGTESLLMSENQQWGTNRYPFATWQDKAAYFSSGLMGIHLQVWANMARIWGNNKRDARLEIAFERASNGTFIGAKDPVPQLPARFTQLLLLNDGWPNVVSNAARWVRALPSADGNSISKSMQDAGVFGFAWFDDKKVAEIVPPLNLRVESKK